MVLGSVEVEEVWMKEGRDVGGAGGSGLGFGGAREGMGLVTSCTNGWTSRTGWIRDELIDLIESGWGGWLIV
jgi:hypothetical protein